ncbi:glycoside hydrolase family 65 protein [Muricauda sp. 2012CJ35-5]|uniref:Glycoside hydrolase family 65 protein n=1 Tax=Flagellimonas spongiicola TaxID=2942208 RepID=A0ABT0PR88_9FLAO|nr:glycoside hydrolase family 65 protein [Allomuricauda spongiicola]MCL6273900.1 glycoside hydrolase family 65 protein [Allomuricauda spongiicola]
MNQDYIKADEWSIVEEGFEKDRVKSSESLFSIGNGAMGQRANFEEHYSGATFQGSYIAGVYYPDKTRVGWWKNGYPEYFAKVLNAPNWIGIDVVVNGEQLDLNSCKSVSNFRRELNMQEGWYQRSFEVELQNGVALAIRSTRFLSLDLDELGAIRYEIQVLNQETQVSVQPYLDSGITNEDSNWDDKFWNTTAISSNKNRAYIESHTMKTNFGVCTYMQSKVYLEGKELSEEPSCTTDELSVKNTYTQTVAKGQKLTVVKFAGYTVDRNHKTDALKSAADEVLDKASELGFEALMGQQKASWGKIWEMSDITIEGDAKAQQGIRFNIFQLNQTYLGKDSRLNIGPKGFTGEKYGGSTYWDTEAYCLPFYMATKNQEVAWSLLEYRYHHLDKAIENAEKLGFANGAALYPMVTMNGEECHNEWEITFEEIHRNGAIAFAIYNYHRFTGDYSYVPKMGLEVLIGIARFWHLRVNFSEDKQKYVLLGVTGPNEYENNVNNNWYTNYLAKWCIDYTLEQLEKVKTEYASDFDRIYTKTKLSSEETADWKKVADNMFFPYSEKYEVYLQQDGFLDKELVKVQDLDKSERPVNQKWSWDRILRSPYIKQADVLQGFYFFEDHFTNKDLERHFNFYEPFTVHESSLSPCVHSIQAAKLGRMEQAYTFYLRTSRLDLDDYNKEVEEGLHITSMAGTWMSIVEGFGGMRIAEDLLQFTPQIPNQWDAYSFKINFRDQILTVTVNKQGSTYQLSGDQTISIKVNNDLVKLQPGQSVAV